MVFENCYLELHSIEIACLNARVNYLRKELWRIATYSMQIYQTNFSAIKQSGLRRYFFKRRKIILIFIFYYIQQYSIKLRE